MEGQFLQIKQESEESVSSIFVKHENHIVNGQCLPLKQELEENDDSILIKPEDLFV